MSRILVAEIISKVIRQCNIVRIREKNYYVLNV